MLAALSLRHFQDAEELPLSPLAFRLEGVRVPLDRLGGGGVGSVARCHKDEDRLVDCRPAGGSGGGVSAPLVRRPKLALGASGGGVNAVLARRPGLALGGMELEGESLPQSGFDCPEVSAPLVRRENWRELPMPDAPGEMPGSCPV